MAREKTWAHAGPTGHIYRHGYGILFEDSYWPCTIRHGRISDVLGNYEGDNGLVLEQFEAKYTTVNGGYSVPDYKSTITAYVPDWYRGEKSHLPTADVNLPALNITIQNRSNPSRGGALDLGVTLGEIRELPRLVFDAARLLKMGRELREPPRFLRELGNAILSGHFGWGQLARDVKGLLDFQRAAQERFNELKRHQESPHGFRKGVSLGSLSATRDAIETNLASCSLGLLRGSESASTSDRRWGQAIYRPLVQGQVFTDSQLRAQALKATSGLRFDGATAYNLLPWTWLLDWFGNLGDVIENMRNDCGYYCDGVLIMRHLRTEYSITRLPADPYEQIYYTSGGSGRFVSDSKYRWIQPPSFLPTLDVPILGGRQMSILGALGARRYRPS